MLGVRLLSSKQSLVLPASRGRTSLSALTGNIGIAASGIAHRLQILLNLRRYASIVVDLLIRNPPEVLQAQIELFGVNLRIVHGEGQRQVIPGIPVKTLLHMRIDSVRITVLGRPGGFYQARCVYHERIIVFPMPYRVPVVSRIERVFSRSADIRWQRSAIGPDFAPHILVLDQ